MEPWEQELGGRASPGEGERGTERDRLRSLLQAALDATADGILVVDRSGRIVASNQRFASMWAISADVLEASDDDRALAHVLDQLVDPEGFLAKVRELYATPEAESFDVLEFRDGKVFERYSAPQRLDDECVGRVWSFRDVTQSVEARERLAAAEERYRTLVEQIPAITYVDVRDETQACGYRTTYISPQLESLLGYRPDDLVPDACAWDRLVHPDDLDRVSREDARATEGGLDWHEDYRMVARDGRILWVSDRAVVVRDAGGRPLYWHGVIFDVTARRRAEDALREAEAKYRALVEQLPAITFLDDLGEEGGPDRFTPLYVSPQVRSILGFTPEEWLSEGGLWRSRLHSEDRERVLGVAERCTASGMPIQLEYRLLAADGRAVWVREESLPVEGAGSRLWQGLMFDITELKQAEERTNEAERRLRRLVEEIPAAIYVYAETAAGSGRFVAMYESPQIEAMLGYSASAWFDDPDFAMSIVDPRDRERVEREEARTDATGDRFLCEYRVRAADGREVWLREEAVLVDDDPGKPLRWLGVVSDVTTEKTAEEEIERYSRELEGTNRALRAQEEQLAAAFDELSRVEGERRRLLDGTVQSLERERARIAIELHDGPIQRLTALGLKLEVLRKRVASGERSAVDRELESAQRHLGANIEALRHLMSGLRPPSLDIHGLEAAIRDYADATCAEAGLDCTVDLDIPERLGEAIETVLYRVTQEALTNVVKHAGARSVRVSLRAGAGTVVLEVVDDGVGLPEAPSGVDGQLHLGILGMRERIEMAGGTWTIGSGDGGGTAVRAEIPLEELHHVSAAPVATGLRDASAWG